MDNQRRREKYHNDEYRKKVLERRHQRYRDIIADPEKKSAENAKKRELYHRRNEEQKEKRRAYMRQYQATPEWKAKKNATRQIKYQKILREAVHYLGGRCQICGLVDDPIVYDFHHRNPSTKQFLVSQGLASFSWKRVVNELDKCTLLCSHCHRKLTCGIIENKEVE
jgi:hypothetical protein